MERKLPQARKFKYNTGERLTIFFQFTVKETKKDDMISHQLLQQQFFSKESSGQLVSAVTTRVQQKLARQEEKKVIGDSILI